MEISLTSLHGGEKAKILRFTGGQHFQSKIRTMGLREGEIIKVVAIQPFMGPMVLEVDGMHFTIGRGMCERIFVEVVG